MCPTCNTDFKPTRSRQKFCSEKCKHGNKELAIKKSGNLPRRFSRVIFPQLNISKVDKRWVLSSNLTWKAHNGEIPEGMEIWFKDSNTFNDMDISNLYLVSRKEYLSLSRKVIQSVNVLKQGNYEGRVEQTTTPNKKEELFDHTKEYF